MKTSDLKELNLDSLMGYFDSVGYTLFIFWKDKDEWWLEYNYDKQTSGSKFSRGKTRKEAILKAVERELGDENT